MTDAYDEVDDIEEDSFEEFKDLLEGAKDNDDIPDSFDWDFED